MHSHSKINGKSEEAAKEKQPLTFRNLKENFQQKNIKLTNHHFHQNGVKFIEF